MNFGTFLRNVRERQGTLLVGSLVTIVFNAASVGLYGLGSILAARALGPEDWGTALWYITGTTTVALFADVLGIFYSNSYFVARGLDRAEGASARSSVLTYGAIAGVGVGLLVTVVPLARGAVFHGLDGAMWGIMVAANVSGLAVVNQARGALLGDKRFVALGALGLVKAGGFGVFAILVVFALHLRTAQYIAAAHLASTAATLGVAAVSFARDGLGRPSGAYILKCARVGWRGASANLLSFLSQRSSQYLVKVLLGPAALGLFGVALSLGDVLTQAPAAMGLVLFPSAAGAKSPDTADRRAVKLTIGTVLVAAVLTLPLVIVPGPIVTLLFGAAYSGAAPVLQAYAPAIALLSGLLVINLHIAGQGYPLGQVLIQALVLALTVAANLLLLPRWGTVGASLAAVVTYGVWLALDLLYLRMSARDRATR